MHIAFPDSAQSCNNTPKTHTLHTQNTHSSSDHSAYAYILIYFLQPSSRPPFIIDSHQQHNSMHTAATNQDNHGLSILPQKPSQQSKHYQRLPKQQSTTQAITATVAEKTRKKGETYHPYRIWNSQQQCHGTEQEKNDWAQLLNSFFPSVNNSKPPDTGNNGDTEENRELSCLR